MRKALLVIFSLAYPIIIYFGLQYWQPKYLVVILLLLFLLRLNSAVSFKYEKIIFAAVLAILLVYTWLSNHALGIRLYPVVVSFSMLALFSYSLIKPPSMIERFARISEPDLPIEAIAYTRKVTKVWVVFLSFNGVVALITALFCSDKLWALYNGFIVYLLMGLLFLIEYIVRLNVRKNHG